MINVCTDSVVLFWKAAYQLKDKTLVINFATYIVQLASEILEALAILVKGRHGCEGEIGKFVLKSSSTSALIVVEMILQTGPGFIRGGLSFENANKEVIRESTINPLEHMSVDFTPLGIIFVSLGRWWGAVYVVGYFVTSSVEREELYPLIIDYFGAIEHSNFVLNV